MPTTNANNKLQIYRDKTHESLETQAAPSRLGDAGRHYPMISGESAANGAFGYGNDFYAREFWRFVRVQEKVAALAMTAMDYPPMQDPASFNLDAIRKQIEEKIKAHHGQ